MTRPAPTVTVPVELMARIAALLENPKAEHPHDVSYLIEEVTVLSAAPAAPQAAGVGADLNAAEKGRLAAVIQMLEPVAENNETVRLYGKEVSVLLKALRAPSREPEGGAVWFGVTGAADETEALAVALFDSRCPGIRMTDEDPHYYRAAAQSAMRAVSDELDTPALATREEAPANTGECPCNLKADDCHPDCPHGREEAPAGSGIAYMAGLLAKAAVEASEEAPAQAGSVSSEADLKRIVKDLIAHRRAGDYDLMADDVANCLWPLLRAQPQAREDAQPVAVCDGVEQPAFEEWASKQGLDMHEHPLHYLFLDAKTDAARQAWKAGLEHAVGRMATHPATDALRVAVEALEKIADARVFDERGEDYRGIAHPYRACRADETEQVAIKALAALQAEQKGGA